MRVQGQVQVRVRPRVHTSVETDCQRSDASSGGRHQPDSPNGNVLLSSAYLGEGGERERDSEGEGENEGGEGEDEGEGQGEGSPSGGVGCSRLAHMTTPSPHTSAA